MENKSKLKYRVYTNVCMYSISCRDAGRDCDCIIEGETKEEILKNAAEHAVKEHGYKEQDIMTPEMKNKIISLIRKS